MSTNLRARAVHRMKMMQKAITAQGQIKANGNHEIYLEVWKDAQLNQQRTTPTRLQSVLCSYVSVELLGAVILEDSQTQNQKSNSTVGCPKQYVKTQRQGAACVSY